MTKQEPLRLSVSRGEAAAKLVGRIEAGKELLGVRIANEADLERARLEQRKWSDYNEELLRQLFSGGGLLDEYDPGFAVISFGGPPPPFHEEVKAAMNGVEHAIAVLESVRSRLPIVPEPAGAPVDALRLARAPSQPSNRVFVVHGHDEAAKHEVARMLAHLDLEPIILHEQANQGRTLIEKFEDHADVGYAIVLLTPDDVGGPRGKPVKSQPRARQNVVFELGYFIGKLGRDRVSVLVKGEVDRPTDVAGVVYIEMAKDWKLSVGKELKAARYSVDLNRLA